MVCNTRVRGPVLQPFQDLLCTLLKSLSAAPSGYDLQTQEDRGSTKKGGGGVRHRRCRRMGFHAASFQNKVMGKARIPCKLTKRLQNIYQPLRVKLKKREGHLVGAGRGFDFTSLFSAFLPWAKSSCGDRWPDAEKGGNAGGAVLASLTSGTRLPPQHILSKGIYL